MIRWLVLFLVFAGPATAQETSLRPVARPEQQVAEPEADENTASDSAVATSLRPQPRTAAVAQPANPCACNCDFHNRDHPLNASWHYKKTWGEG